MIKGKVSDEAAVTAEETVEEDSKEKLPQNQHDEVS